MRKILVVSDSHGDVDELTLLISKHSDCELILHAGDYSKDMRLCDNKGIPYYVVNGNCDSYYSDYGSDEEIIEVGKIKIFLTHGHKYHVKQTLDDIVRKAKDLKVDICIYGHTHLYDRENIDNIFFVNPGSISRGRGQIGESYAMIYLTDDGRLENIEIIKIS